MAGAFVSSYVPFIGGVYAFRTYDSAEFRYVGMTTNSVTVRERQHFKVAVSGERKTPFYDWLRKHGRENAFAMSLAVVTTDLDDLAAAEIEWMLCEPCSKGMRDRPSAMSSASAMRTTPASTVSGAPPERCEMMAWRISERTIGARLGS